MSMSPRKQERKPALKALLGLCPQVRVRVEEAREKNGAWIRTKGQTVGRTASLGCTGGSVKGGERRKNWKNHISTTILTPTSSKEKLGGHMAQHDELQTNKLPGEHAAKHRQHKGS